MLVKFCKPEHNLLTECNSIRLGTLEYYRKFDPSFLIADTEEGIDSHEVNHVGGVPSDSECIEFLKSVGFFSPDPNFSIQGIMFKRTFPNSYIWCCQITDSIPQKENGSQFDSEYTSLYKIDNPDLFCQYLMSRLHSEMKRENFSKIGKEIFDSIPIKDISNIAIMPFHGPVVYVQKKAGALNFGKFDSYAKKIPIQYRPLFVKTNKYANENEYRFAFVIINTKTGQVMPVRKKPLDIKVLPISGCGQ